MMTLEQFVADTLTQIVMGVRKARDSVRSVGGEVNPRHGRGHDGVTSDMGYLAADLKRFASPVDFDVAVTATAEAGSQGKVGVVVGIFGGSAGIQESTQASQVSRIKFRVYLALPVGQRSVHSEPEDDPEVESMP